MSDVSVVPPTIDYWGPSGNGGFRNASVRYENHITDNITYGASMEMPIVNANYYSGSTHSVAQAVPDFSAYLQYSWGDDMMSCVRLSGVYRSMAYYDDILFKGQTVDGFGAQVSGKANIIPNLTAYYRAIGGFGISSYINDLSVLPVDMVQNSVIGDMTSLGMYGAYAGMKYNINDDMFVSATYSQSRIYSREGVKPSPNSYKFSQYVVANGFCNVSKNLQLGAEYLFGAKTNFDGINHTANRFSLLVQYSF